MPLRLANVAQEQGRDVHIIALAGEALQTIETFSHTWIKWGEFGRLFKALENHNCQEVVIIGSVSRPDMKHVRLDLGALKSLPFLLSLMSGGDDSILSRIVQFFETKGFLIKGIHEVAPQFLAPEGVMTKKKPSAQDHKDIAKGLEVVQTLGALDVGQAAIVAKDYVLAVEAAEGTDAMLERAKSLRQWWKKGRQAGVLVKCPKPGQEQRIDMPTIGSHTINLAADAGLSGLAIMAGQVLIADQDEMIKAAHNRGLFVVGIA